MTDDAPCRSVRLNFSTRPAPRSRRARRFWPGCWRSWAAEGRPHKTRARAPARVIKTSRKARDTHGKDQDDDPLVEMDGDEMTRILWRMIKEELLEPFVELKCEYYDLGLEHRDATRDQVTMDAALANKIRRVGQMRHHYPQRTAHDRVQPARDGRAPNGTIRAVLDGTVFRAPILIDCIKPVVKNWKKPITIARHAYGDVYRGTEFRIPRPGKAELLFTSADGAELRERCEFECPGILQGTYNKDTSIASFARSCFNYALATKQDLWFSTKDTISKKYDHTFKDIFADIFETEYKEAFAAAGIEYFYTLIDDAVARVIRSEGGFIWACKTTTAT